jgi:orotidine-5'-phosphate decarboxylase
MYVVGATKASYLKDLRKIIPNNFLLIPGVGTQGGDLNEVCKHLINNDVGLIINSSRSIIYSSSNQYFADDAKKSAMNLQIQMHTILKDNNII